MDFLANFDTLDIIYIETDYIDMSRVCQYSNLIDCRMFVEEGEEEKMFRSG